MPENIHRGQPGTCIRLKDMAVAERGLSQMGKILKVTPNNDYTLLIEFEHGNQILFNMKPMLKSLPYRSLNDLARFKNIKYEEKAIFWPGPANADESIVPMRLTVDNILFTIRG